MEEISKRHHIGLCLSGGGALGFAHLGAIKALEEYGIRPTCISGASMGALVGLFYASGMSSGEICKMIKEEKLYRMVTIFTPSGLSLKKKLGLSSHHSLIKLFKKYIPSNDFESLRYEFGVSVCNISSQECMYVSSGDHLKEYVLASMSQPAIFNPIIINGEYHIDGGTLDNMPASIIRDKCDVLIGIDVHSVAPIKKMNSLLDVTLRSAQTLLHHNSLPGRAMCDFLIEPRSCEKYNIFDFHKFTAIYHQGYSDAIAYLKRHPEMAGGE